MLWCACQDSLEEKTAGNTIENQLVGEGGKAGEWSRGSLESRGVFCSLRGGDKAWGSARRMGGGRDYGKQLGKKPPLQEAEMLLLMLSFLDKILVYLNTSAPRSRSSPDTITFAFSPWRFPFHLQQVVKASVLCRVSHPQAAAWACFTGGTGRGKPGGQGFAPSVPLHLPVVLLHSRTSAAGRAIKIYQISI